jgi:hypothetical protein
MDTHTAPPPPLSPRDKDALLFYITHNEDPLALAEYQRVHYLDILAWTSRPDVAAYLAHHQRLQTHRQRNLALAVLQHLLTTADNPTESRRAATTILRATDPARAHRRPQQPQRQESREAPSAPPALGTPSTPPAPGAPPVSSTLSAPAAPPAPGQARATAPPAHTSPARQLPPQPGVPATAAPASTPPSELRPAAPISPPPRQNGRSTHTAHPP